MPIPRKRPLVASFALLAGLIAAPSLVAAHPHVSVSAKSTILAEPDGRITAIRHEWTFDEGFSAYSTTGLDTNKDGALDREELAALAKVNVESLHEYSYFTRLKAQAAEAAYGEVRDYWLSFDGKALTLHFTLPLAGAPVFAKGAKLDVSDPSYFVAFDFAPDKPVTVEGAKGACTASIKRPAAALTQRLSNLSESFFQSLQSGASADWSSTAHISCP